MDPREAGFVLERLIGTAAKLLPIKHLSEPEIKTELGDSSLNGVDHWISYMNAHILIQTKWRESIGQSEVAQFLACADRIQSRFAEGDEVYLVWVSKHEPTKNSMATLVARNVHTVCCSVSVEALARCAILWIAETLGLDPMPAMGAFTVSRVGRAVTQKSACVVGSSGGASGGAVGSAGGGGYASAGGSGAPVRPPTPTKVLRDETEAGQRDIHDFQQLINDLHRSIGMRMQNALSCCGFREPMTVVHAGFPQRVEDWSNGTTNKVNFNSVLRSLRTICVPTKTKRFQSQHLFLYCKMRYISTELASRVPAYMAKRTQMIGEGSAWAKKTPVLLCVPEPMTQEEFKACVGNCSDAWFNVNRAGVIEKVPSGIENQFFMNYYVN